MAEDGVRWPRVLRPFAARPRLIAGALVGLAMFFLAQPMIVRPVTRALISWDCGVIVFVALSFAFMRTADQSRMKHHATTHDEGRHFILLLAIGAAIASVAAIGAELASAKGQAMGRETLRVALAAGTIGLSWLFVQLVFALHYAHVYYAPEEEVGGAHKEGLDFPGEEPPDYWDFLHFAMIIGATAQTADVTIVSKELRRVSTVHSLIAFAFNTAILALMINLAAGLF
jgi:uncharacterized membrane protein